MVLRIQWNLINIGCDNKFGDNITHIYGRTQTDFFVNYISSHDYCDYLINEIIFEIFLG